MMSGSSLVGNPNSSLLKRRVMTLPRIEHPSRLINEEDQNDLDIRGRSANGNGQGKLIRSESSTPTFRSHRRRSSSILNSSKNSFRKSSEPLREIPENVPTVYGEDRDEVRLPIFGHRSSSSRSSYGKENVQSSPSNSRLVVDQFELILREKVRSELSDIRAKFRHASSLNSNGEISRQALQHLITSIFAPRRQISPTEIDKLFERLQLKHIDKITFDQFLNCLFPGEDDLPNWVTRQSSSSNEFLRKRTAAQMFIILKEKARTKHKDLIVICPSLDGGPSSKIFKGQFQKNLIDMGYRMKDKEFDKLWDKFDTDGFHSITSEKFLKRLSNEESINEKISTGRSETQDQQSAILKVTDDRNSSPSETSRLQTGRIQLDDNQIEKWLNHKFSEGFGELERSLERLDTKQTGILSRDRFLEEFKRFNVQLEGNLFDLFLKRLNIDLSLTNGFIPYRDVVNAFKQQSDPTKKRLNNQYNLPEEENPQKSLERQVEYLISQNFDRIRDEFIRLDNYRNGTINSNEMRILIEDLLQFPLRADEYYQLLKHFPKDSNGKIQYKEYLKQIKDQTNNSSNQTKSIIVPQWEYMRSKHIQESLDQEHLLKKKRDKLSSEQEFSPEQKSRSIEQLREIVKRTVRNRYKDIEEEFTKVDRSSYGELTPDLLFHLFKRLNIEPEINRSEIILLWSRCHLKENGNLDFLEFLREFGYSKRSAHYPNAKQNPPIKGDADFLLTSRKLYGDSVLIHGTAKNIIRSNWDQLRREFTQLDPYRTGFLQSEEFDQILIELCPSINEEDLHTLKKTFEKTNDSRINYVKFLKYHAPIPQLIDEVDQTTRQSLRTTTTTHPSRTSLDRSPLNELINKLRRKLLDCSKELKRAFKEQDLKNNGSISMKRFKQILNEFKCYLNDEEFDLLSSQLDTQINGTINYLYFIQQYLKHT